MMQLFLSNLVVAMLFAQVRFLQITPYSYYLCKDCDCKTLDHRYGLRSKIVLYSNLQLWKIMYIWQWCLVDWLDLLIWHKIISGSIEFYFSRFFLVYKLKKWVITIIFALFQPWAHLSFSLGYRKYCVPQTSYHWEVLGKFLDFLLLCAQEGL